MAQRANECIDYANGRCQNGVLNVFNGAVGVSNFRRLVFRCLIARCSRERRQWYSTVFYELKKVFLRGLPAVGGDPS